MIVFVGKTAFGVKQLNAAQWAYCIVLGVISIPVGVIIRLIPDELIRRLIPAFFKRKPTPHIVADDDQWNQGLIDIKEELKFMRALRGGRLSALKFKIEQARETLTRSRRSSQSLPGTPVGGTTGSEHDASPAPPTPDSRTRRRARSRSNSAFGAAAAMTGIIAGSIAGGWSPIERREGDNDSIRFGRNRSRSDLEAQDGVDVHPDTKSTDPIIVEQPHEYDVPPSQNKDTTPNFNVGPFAGDPKLKPSKNGKDKDLSP